MAYEIDTTVRAYLIFLCKLQIQKSELITSIDFHKAPYVAASAGKSGGQKKGLQGQRFSVFNVNYQINPIYFDEISLSKFTEDFLDILIEDVYKKVTT